MGKNPYVKLTKDKKLSSGKDINSIFPLTISSIKPPVVETDPVPGSGP